MIFEPEMGYKIDLGTYGYGVARKIVDMAWQPQTSTLYLVGTTFHVKEKGDNPFLLTTQADCSRDCKVGMRISDD